MKNKRVDLRNITTRDFMMTYIPPKKNLIFLYVFKQWMLVFVYMTNIIYISLSS